MFEAVTYDFWNTLCVPEDERVRQVRRGIMAEGFGRFATTEVTDEALEAAFTEAWEQFQTAWKANKQFGSTGALRVVATELGVEITDAELADLAAAFDDATVGTPAPLAPHVEVTLRTLHEAGVRLGIICDVGLTPSRILRTYLADHGVLDYFHHWSFSDEVGVYKPRTEIFTHALTGLGGVVPDRAAHVGDLRRTDVAGAIAHGMTAVRYTGVAEDEYGVDEGEAEIEAHHVFDDHRQLLDLMGLS